MKQKSQLHWFKEWNTNSQFLHSWIRVRRRRLFIHKIHANGEWIKGDKNIGKDAYEYFKELFTGESKSINETSLECIPRMVTQEHNDRINSQPTMNDLQEVVFSMNPNFAAGANGINGYFFRKCWHIINHYFMRLVLAFFSIHDIPKYFSHSSIVILPKMNNPNKLKEFRPISLSNFIRKIISKLLSTRLSPILPYFLSLDQFGFVKGRSITETNMLSQEITLQIKEPNVGSNVIIKLDIAKAYDRVSWAYIYLVLRKMGFEEIFIDMVWRTKANKWYSFIIN